MLDGAIGIWLFYVQYQFRIYDLARYEGNWRFLTRRALRELTLSMPAVLRWFTANIGVPHRPPSLQPNPILPFANRPSRSLLCSQPSEHFWRQSRVHEVRERATAICRKDTSLTYVVNESCIKCKLMDCVEISFLLPLVHLGCRRMDGRSVGIESEQQSSLVAVKFRF
jgi:hypothetical protein